MATFTVNQPIVTREPAITVDAGLPIGRHRFRLEVTDTAGLVSKPMEVIVTVRRPLILDPGTVVVGPVIPTPIDPVVIRPTGVLTGVTLPSGLRVARGRKGPKKSAKRKDDGKGEG